MLGAAGVTRQVQRDTAHGAALWFCSVLRWPQKVQIDKHLLTEPRDRVSTSAQLTRNDFAAST